MSKSKKKNKEFYICRDIEDGSSACILDERTLKKYIRDWNDDLGTKYKNYKDYNEGEEYYEIVPINKVKGTKENKEICRHLIFMLNVIDNTSLTTDDQLDFIRNEVTLLLNTYFL